MPVSPLWRVCCRTIQTALYTSSFLIPWPRPQLLLGRGAILQVPQLVSEKRWKSGLVVTDEGIMRQGLADGMLQGLQKAGVRVSVYKDVTPNPTVDQVEAALKVYKSNRCDHIIAVGGGSPIDCAKLVGVRYVRPRTSLSQMRGIFRVLRKIPPIICIPTTAGTGSECTLAAVVTDPKTLDKYALADYFLFPPYAVLDPLLTLGVPKFVTATTGLDALTHAVEAYLNCFHTKKTDKYALRAVELIFSYLQRCYDNGADIEAREKVQEAAHLAGLAFTRAYVGNVHAIAHTLGGFYHVPHGYANAVVLPHVLEMYGAVVYKRMAKLADAAGISGGTNAEKSQKFIKAIKDFNVAMGIPPTLSSATENRYVICDEDIPRMVHRALREANPLYPVPVIFGRKEMEAVYRKIR